jgi:hypothetical protein
MPCNETNDPEQRRMFKSVKDVEEECQNLSSETTPVTIVWPTATTNLYQIKTGRDDVVQL